MSSLKPHRRQTVRANHKTEALLRARHVQTLLSGEHLSGGKVCYYDTPENKLVTSTWCEVFLSAALPRIKHGWNPILVIHSTGVVRLLRRICQSLQMNGKSKEDQILYQLDDWHGSFMHISGVQINQHINRLHWNLHGGTVDFRDMKYTKGGLCTYSYWITLSSNPDALWSGYLLVHVCFSWLFFILYSKRRSLSENNKNILHNSAMATSWK